MSSVIYSIFLLRIALSHGPNTVPGGLEKDELPGQQGTLQQRCKDTTAALGLGSPQWHGPCSQPFHIKIRVMMLSNLDNSHTLGSRTSQHATEMSWASGHCSSSIYHGLGLVCSPSKPLSLYLFPGANLLCCSSKRKKGSPREDQQEQQPWSL